MKRYNIRRVGVFGMIINEYLLPEDKNERIPRRRYFIGNVSQDVKEYVSDLPYYEVYRFGDSLDKELSRYSRREKKKLDVETIKLQMSLCILGM